VQKRILSIAIITLLFFSFFNSGCSKLDTTDIGSDLLPAVDNVHTFDTLLTINSTQGIFSLDSTQVANSDDQVIGKINNDPLFGTTKADVYAQFKPSFYPYYYGNANDTIVGFDSVVLCLSYKGFWGDSTIPMQLQVKEVSPTAGGIWDSLALIKTVNYSPLTNSSIIGTTTVDFTTLGNYMMYANKKDSVRNQIRIKLSPAFANALFARDTLPLGNNSFRTDSAFKLFQNGIAIQANGSGNGIFYTNLTDSTTRLEVHFRRKNGGAIDTTYSSLRVASVTDYTLIPSSSANNIVRNRSGAPVSAPPATDIYLQTAPGTYANLSIPALSTIDNRIIHRAELIVEQIPFNVKSDSDFSAPPYLYLDIKDTGTANKWKPIYFDLNPNVSYDPDYIYKSLSYFPTGGIDFFYHGGYVRNKTDVFGNAAKYYNFNITRYVQQIVTKHTPNYPLRLYAPYDIAYPQYSTSVIPFSNKLANGRVKVGSGSNPNYRMRLRLVYSRI
jgi:hypothetical protein